MNMLYSITDQDYTDPEMLYIAVSTSLDTLDGSSDPLIVSLQYSQIMNSVYDDFYFGFTTSANENQQVQITITDFKIYKDDAYMFIPLSPYFSKESADAEDKLELHSFVEQKLLISIRDKCYKPALYPFVKNQIEVSQIYELVVDDICDVQVIDSQPLPRSFVEKSEITFLV
jgi:hypothetical protein